MEQWNHNKDFTNFEFENKIVTLCRFNWNEYQSFLSPYILLYSEPSLYDNFLKKAENRIFEEDDDEKNEDDNENEDNAEKNEDEDDDEWGHEKNHFNRSVIFGINNEEDDDDELDWKKRLTINLKLFRAITKAEDIMVDKLSEWFTAPIFSHKCTNPSTYSLRHFFQIRYISKYKNYLPQKIEKYSDDYISGITPKDMSRQATYASYLISKLENKTGERFNSFHKNEQQDILYGMFDSILGKDVFQDRVRNQLDFNIYDVQFFSFLINTAEDNNGKALRHRDFKKIEPCYWSFIKSGIINLVREHKEFENIDTSMLFEKWDLMSSIYDFNCAVDRFNCTTNNFADNLMTVKKFQKQFIEEAKKITDQIDQISIKYKKLIKDHTEKQNESP